MVSNIIHIWVLPIPPTISPEEERRLLSILGEQEMSRYQRLSNRSRQIQYLLGHALARFKAASLLNLFPQNVPLIFEEGGKPRLEGNSGWHCSLSHTSELIAWAMAPFPVGVDLEGERVIKNPLKIARRFFSTTEVAELESLDEMAQQKRFRQIWCLREALYKAETDSPHPWQFELFHFFQHVMALAAATSALPQVIVEKVVYQEFLIFPVP